MRRLPGAFTSLALGVLANACGGDDSSDDSTAASVSVSGSSDTGPACVQPNDETVGPAVEITIVNNSLGVVWLAPDAFGDPGFTLAGADGEPFAHSQDPCLPGCEAVDADPQAVCLDCDPEAVPDLVRIEVDGRWTATWSGGAWREDDVACVDATCTGTRAAACSVVEEVLDGQFTLSAKAHAMASGCPTADCSCTPDANGACTVSGTPVEPSIQAIAQLDVPNQTTLELMLVQ